MGHKRVSASFLDQYWAKWKYQLNGGMEATNIVPVISARENDGKEQKRRKNLTSLLVVSN